MWIDVDNSTSNQRLKYLEELESGRHHRGLSPKPRKHEQNRVFVYAAVAAGYSESTAKNHKQKIDAVLGLEEVEKSYQIGLLTSLREEKSTKAPIKKAVPVVLPGVERIEFGNEAHRQMMDLAGKVDSRAVEFLRLQGSPDHKSDQERMLAAGFSESQAKNPGRLWKALGKIDPDSVMDALHFLGVTNFELGNILKDFFERREVRWEKDPDTGEMVMIETERRCGASVKLAFDNLFRLMQLQEGSAKPPSNTVRLSEEEKERLEEQMRERGIVASK